MQGTRNSPLRLIGVRAATYISRSAIECAASTWCPCVSRNARDSFGRLVNCDARRTCVAWARVQARGRVLSVCRADHWTGFQHNRSESKLSVVRHEPGPALHPRHLRGIREARSIRNRFYEASAKWIFYRFAFADDCCLRIAGGAYSYCLFLTTRQCSQLRNLLRW